MNFKELQDLLEFIDKNNSWKNTLLRPKGCKYEHYPLVKYVDFNLDTRTNEIWRVVFRSWFNKEFTHIDANNKDNKLKEIYSFLKGECE